MTTNLNKPGKLPNSATPASAWTSRRPLRQLDRLPVSMHCWQGDDVVGFRTRKEACLHASSRWPSKAMSPSAKSLQPSIRAVGLLNRRPDRLVCHHTRSKLSRWQNTIHAATNTCYFAWFAAAQSSVSHRLNPSLKAVALGVGAVLHLGCFAQSLSFDALGSASRKTLTSS